MIEGGSKIFTSALKQGIVDKCTVHIAPLFLGGGKMNNMIQTLNILSLDDRIELKDPIINQLGTNVEITGYLRDPKTEYMNFFNQDK